MGVIVLTETTDIPVTTAGLYAGICWGSDISDHEKNFKRGMDCLKANHGRVLEFPQIYMEISGYSARVIREFSRHVGGLPTYLQESTRYVDYTDIKYTVPPSIENNELAKRVYNNTINCITNAYEELNKLGIKREDAAMLLPMSMHTKIVYRTNLRGLIDMSRQRLCNRAYWEYRKLFNEIISSLAFYSDEWKFLIEEEKIFHSKCEDLGYCPEICSCGKYKRKEEK